MTTLRYEHMGLRGASPKEAQGRFVLYLLIKSAMERRGTNEWTALKAAGRTAQECSKLRLYAFLTTRGYHWHLGRWARSEVAA